MLPSRRPWTVVLWGACAFLGGAVASGVAGARAEDSEGRYRSLAVFARALHYIETTYVEVVDSDTLIHGAIRGMVDTLDRHSRFIDPEELAALRSMQPEGPEATVEARRLAEGSGYLHIRRFSGSTAAELDRALHSLSAEDPLTGLVLDLRDNPGGIVSQAVRVADRWISAGTIVATVSAKGRTEVERAYAEGTQPAYPLVVLVNGRTASAAEVVAAALQDHGRAALVGTHTLGKGTVQTVIELGDGSAMTLTIARYLSPHGRVVEGEGLRPDRIVAPGRRPPSDDGDRQLRAAVEHLAALYRPKLPW